MSFFRVFFSLVLISLMTKLCEVCLRLVMHGLYDASFYSYARLFPCWIDAGIVKVSFYCTAQNVSFSLVIPFLLV